MKGIAWRDQAACLDHDPELFFPIGTTGPAEAQAAEAKAVCAGCPVAAQCLAEAVDDNQQHGVWGGYTEQERYAGKRRAARLAAKAASL